MGSPASRPAATRADGRLSWPVSLQGRVMWKPCAPWAAQDWTPPYRKRVAARGLQTLLRGQALLECASRLYPCWRCTELCAFELLT